jgi:hypothetical protein
LEKLSPKIKEAILEGNPNLNVTTLSLTRNRFPALWKDQEEAMFRKFVE